MEGASSRAQQPKGSQGCTLMTRWCGEVRKCYTYTVAQQHGKSKQQAVWKTAIWENHRKPWPATCSHEETTKEQLTLNSTASLHGLVRKYVCFNTPFVAVIHLWPGGRSLQGDWEFNPEHIRGIHGIQCWMLLKLQLTNATYFSSARPCPCAVYMCLPKSKAKEHGHCQKILPRLVTTIWQRKALWKDLLSSKPRNYQASASILQWTPEDYHERVNQRSTVDHISCPWNWFCKFGGTSHERQWHLILRKTLKELWNPAMDTWCMITFHLGWDAIEKCKYNLVKQGQLLPTGTVLPKVSHPNRRQWALRVAQWLWKTGFEFLLLGIWVFPRSG